MGLRRRKHRCDAEVVRVSRGAILVRRCDGLTQCWCPFLCMAASEPCEFSAEAAAFFKDDG